MKRLIRFLLWLAGTAVFLLITAHFTLRYLLNAPKFKSAALTRIERITGRPAACGRIDYSLFPFALVVRDIALQEPGGGREFASLRSFSAVVDLRKKEIAALYFDRPTLYIAQNTDGTFNFSDWVAAKPAGASAPAGAPARPRPQPKPAPPPLTIRLVQIDHARIEFVRRNAAKGPKSFVVSDLDFTLHDFSPARPFRMKGRASLGGSSSFEFEFSAPPYADYTANPGAWPVGFNSRLDIRDFADLAAFLPPGTLPFQNLWATLNIQGALTEHLTILLHLETPGEPTLQFPMALQGGGQAEVSLPAPVAAHLFAGAPLPEDLQFEPPACTPPPGAITLTDNPWRALLLKRLQATASLSFPKIDYGQNHFSDGSASLELQDGRLTVPEAKLAAYGGTIATRGEVQLLDCPLDYRFDRITADNLALEQALAANGLNPYTNFSGRMHWEASASGYAVSPPGLTALTADATARIDGLQSVGPGGSLLDQAWLRLDHPLLLKLVPHLKPKVKQAKDNAGTITTSRYDEATATLSLRNGQAALSETRFSLPGYRLFLAGALWPFDDRMDLTARLVATPEESATLTDGKDLSAYLPYEDGGLMIPMTLRGPWRKPEVRPDLDRLLQNAMAGVAGENPDSPLDQLSDSDKKHVQQGLQILQGLGTLFEKP